MSGAQQPQPDPLTISPYYPKYVVPEEILNPPLTVQLANAQIHAERLQIHPDRFYAEVKCFTADVVERKTERW